MVTCNVGTAQYDDRIVKCEENKIKVPPNVRNVQSNVMLVLPNVTMEPSNVRKKNNKGTTKCEKKYSHV